MKTILDTEQLRAAEFLADRKRALLADDVGFGKTLEFLGALRLISPRRTLIVTGGQAAFQVEAEVGNLGLGLPVRVLTAERRARRVYYTDPAPITVISYHTLRSDAEYLAKVPWDVYILDDASAAKNPESKLSQASNRIASRARYAWAITATPVERNLLELWGILYAIDFYPFGDLDEFSAQHVVWGWRTNHRGQNERTPVEYVNIPQLRRKLAEFTLRRTKSAGPEITRKVIKVGLEPLQIRLYLQARSGHYGTSLFSKFTKCLQFCDSTAFEEGAKWESSKIDLVTRSIKLLDAKVMVFSMWRKPAIHLARELEKIGVRFVMLTGLTDKVTRYNYQREFQTNPEIQVAICTRAAEQALNLQVAQYLITINRLANPSRMRQVIGRIDRRGSEHERIYVLELVATNTVEERMLALLEARAELFKDVFGSYGKIPKQYMEEILRDDIASGAPPVTLR